MEQPAVSSVSLGIPEAEETRKQNQKDPATMKAELKCVTINCLKFITGMYTHLPYSDCSKWQSTCPGMPQSFKKLYTLPLCAELLKCQVIPVCFLNLVTMSPFVHFTLRTHYSLALKLATSWYANNEPYFQIKCFHNVFLVQYPCITHTCIHSPIHGSFSLIQI